MPVDLAQPYVSVLSPILEECCAELRVITERRGDRGRFLDPATLARHGSN
jgi:hypothetical protein